MSNEEAEEDEMAEIARTARWLQQSISHVPLQAKLVSKMTAEQANRITREMNKLRPKPPSLQQISKNPAVRRSGQSRDIFASFVGRRRKVKNGMDILTGR
jgi:hypothetical protein